MRLGPLLVLASLLAVSGAAAAQATTYHNHATLEQDLRALVEAHPGLATLSPLGESASGLTLWRVDVALMDDPDWEDQPILLVDGGHHGNEHLGIEAAYYFLEALLDAAESDPSVLEGKRVVVVPVVNPDGWAANSRVNANAVNLNRNYPWMWGERGAENPLNNAGPEPASEPETKLMMDLMAQGDVRGYVTFHTGSFDLVLPWSPEQDAPIPDWDLYAVLLAEAKERTGLDYRDPGATGESHAHAYGNLGIVGILPEVSTEQFYPATEGDVRDRVKEGVAVAFLWLEHLTGLGGHLEVVEATSDGVTVRNVGLGAAYLVSVGAATVDAVEAGATVTIPADGTCTSLMYLRLDLPDIERPPATTVDLVDGSCAAAGEGALLPIPTAGILATLAGMSLVALGRRRVA